MNAGLTMDGLFFGLGFAAAFAFVGVAGYVAIDTYHEWRRQRRGQAAIEREWRHKS